jgi:hypothetical protein
LKLKNLLIIITILFINNCESNGQFGWAITRDQGKEILEKELSQITEYKMMNENLIFSPMDTIHYVYILPTNPLNSISADDEIYVSLEKESLGYIEIDIKKKLIESSSNSLNDKFKNLEVGHYIMKIGVNGDLRDSVEFDIVPDEGYELHESSKIEDEKDDILKYSK